MARFLQFVKPMEQTRSQLCRDSEERRNMKQHERQAQKGFTLVELLIVVTISGFIAAIMIPNLMDALR